MKKNKFEVQKIRNELVFYEKTQKLRELKDTKYDFKDGDKVKIDYKELTSTPDWKNQKCFGKEYREFIENNKDTIFTIRKYIPRDDLWEFVENPKWLTWYGYLLKVDSI